MSTLELEHLKHSSASGNNITLAADGSISVTGDLTVDTTTLKVDTTDDRVGIGVTPYSNARLTIGGTDSGGYPAGIQLDNNNTSGAEFFMLATDTNWSIGNNKFIMGHGTPASSNADMVIHSNGNITKPNQPSFHAYRSSGQVISGQVVFQFTSTLHNIGGHYDTSTYQFTAPVTGSYFISFKSLLYSMGSSEYFDFYPQVNGVNRRRYEFTGNSGYHSQFDYSDVYYLNAGDTVRMTGTDRNTGSFSLYGNENHFSGFLLG